MYGLHIKKRNDGTMKKITEFRRINWDAVRSYCIGKNLYTKGNNEQYEYLLFVLCDDSRNCDTELLELIANDIINHSDSKKMMNEYGCTRFELLCSVMFDLAKDCCTVLFE